MKVRLFLVVMFVSLQCLAVDIRILGDIEGNFNRLASFLKNNKDAFGINSQGKWFVRDGFHFLFLGDAIDHGPGDVDVLDTLNEIHETSPRRSTYLRGNRDINKIHFKRILSPENMAIVSEGFKTWVMENGIEPNEENLFRNRALRMKHMYSVGMNAKNAFRNRKEYWQKKLGREVPDEEVVERILEEYGFNPQTKKWGRGAEFLLNSKMAFAMDGVFAVHGALTDTSDGRVPGIDRIIENPWEYFRKLNAFGDREVLAALTSPVGAGAEILLAFQKPIPGTAANQESSNYGRYSDQTGNPIIPTANLLRKWRKAGFHTFVSGHTPVGEHPGILISEDGESRIVLLDVSGSSRDDAPYASINSGEVHLESISSDLRKVVARHRVGERSMLGKNLNDSSLVIGMDPLQGNYLTLINQGRPTFKNVYKWIAPTEIFQMKKLVCPNVVLSKAI